jgi:hypothetical protein
MGVHSCREITVGDKTTDEGREIGFHWSAISFARPIQYLHPDEPQREMENFLELIYWVMNPLI